MLELDLAFGNLLSPKGRKTKSILLNSFARVHAQVSQLCADYQWLSADLRKPRDFFVIRYLSLFLLKVSKFFIILHKIYQFDPQLLHPWPVSPIFGRGVIFLLNSFTAENFYNNHRSQTLLQITRHYLKYVG